MWALDPHLDYNSKGGGLRLTTITGVDIMAYTLNKKSKFAKEDHLQVHPF